MKEAREIPGNASQDIYQEECERTISFADSWSKRKKHPRAKHNVKKS